MYVSCHVCTPSYFSVAVYILRLPQKAPSDRVVLPTVDTTPPQSESQTVGKEDGSDEWVLSVRMYPLSVLITVLVPNVRLWFI